MPTKKLKDIWRTECSYRLATASRELALFNLALDCKLQSCDLVRLHSGDACHEDIVASCTRIIQQRTRRPSARCNLRSSSKLACRWPPDIAILLGGYFHPRGEGHGTNV